MMKLGLKFLRVCGLILFLAAFFAVAASVSADDPLEIYACRYGQSSFPESSAFRGGRADKTVEFAWAFYVVRSGMEITLIDTGFSNPGIAKSWHVKPTREPAQLLADLSINPATVSRVIITHIHFDHIANLPLFPKAQVVISRRDRDNYVSKKPFGGVTYDQRVADILNDPARTHVVDERETIAELFDVEVVGGHTAGSAVVHLTHLGTHYVLAGDECYLCANRTEQRPIGQTVDLKRNAAFLARIADPSIVVLPCHDPGIFTSYPVVKPGIVRIFGPQQ